MLCAFDKIIVDLHEGINELLSVDTVSLLIKPPPPVGAIGGYMFSGRPSVRACVRPSVIHVVVLCFRDISSIC